MQPRKRIPYLLKLLALLLLLAVSSLQARPKIDVLVMKNGDRITCEIKSLSQGQLMIKTSYTTGSIPVDWKAVERIESEQYFRVEMKDGARHTGAIELVPEAADDEHDFRVTERGEAVEVPQREVVVIDQLERSNWSNLSGGISAGMGFTKNNSTSNLDLNANLAYKTDRRLINNSYSATIKKQTDGADTNRHNFSTVFNNQIKGQWFSIALADFLKSDEQNLDLRTTVGGGVARYLKRSNLMELYVAGGAVYTRERFTEDTGLGESLNNAEGMLAANFSFFRFDSTTLSAGTTWFPSFNVAGRYRVNNDVTFKWDLWGDLYWNFSFWQNYDSKPPLDTSKSDYGISSTVGWSFP